MTQHTYRGIDYSKLVASKNEKFSPTARQIRNLIDLAVALRTAPPPTFGMHGYATTDGDTAIALNFSGFSERFDDELRPEQMRKVAKYETKRQKHSCNTAACALGTAAYHGIGLTARNSKTWAEYSMLAFGVDAMEVFMPLFASCWANHDDTPEGAAARILAIVCEGTGILRIVHYKAEMKEFCVISDPYKDVVIEPLGDTL